MEKAKWKILLIRFSSFGDVTQCLSVPTRLAEKGEVHWVTRVDMAPLLQNHPHVHRVWTLDRREGWRGLMRLMRDLSRENFTHVYDAHNNLRSRLISAYLWRAQTLRKSQKRWKRFLLFRFRINQFKQPFSGQRDLLEPLVKWGLSKSLPSPPQIFPSAENFAVVDPLLQKSFAGGPFVVLCASAAFELKRWPLEYWAELIRLLPEVKFALLGGPTDSFLSHLVEVSPDRVFSFAGRLSLMESAAVLARSKSVVTNDTGLLHVAEQLGHPAIALMGPAPFGFPSRPSTQILQLNLECRPCSKHGQGPCVNPTFQQCLRDIRPLDVKRALENRGGI